VRRVLIDSNLLVLLVVGRVDQSIISRHKRTLDFSRDDYHLLNRTLGEFGGKCVTQPVLAEASNLLCQAPSGTVSGLLDGLRGVVVESQELPLSARVIVDRAEYTRLGFTDCSLIGLENKELTLLTTDLQLYLSALRVGRSAINFNHLRELPGNR